MEVDKAVLWESVIATLEDLVKDKSDYDATKEYIEQINSLTSNF